MTQTSVEFQSALFQPFLSDNAQVNPGCYGAELAWWLARELAQCGIETSYPNFENWGWFLEYIVDDNEYWLLCGNVTGQSSHWRIALECKAKGWLGRNKAPVTAAKPLLDAIARILSDTVEINTVVWFGESL